MKLTSILSLIFVAGISLSGFELRITPCDDSEGANPDDCPIIQDGE